MMSTSLQNTGVFLLLLILAWTGLGTHDSLTWLMEVTPVIIIVPLLLLLVIAAAIPKEAKVKKTMG